MTKNRRLRQLLEQPGIIRSLGAHDVLTAMLIEQAGFETVFIGGFGTSASLLGLPDLNFLTLSEMADAIRRMSARLHVPLIADGDTGHGDLHHVVRTVQSFCQAGASGVILEDQVAPKRCGHFEGKQVIPAEEMAMKIQAAVSARPDKDFVVIARTDAREPLGLDEAIRRVNLYAEAGADVCFIEAPLSAEELQRIPREVSHPLLVNMLWGGKTPILSVQELEQLGYKIVVCPIESLLVSAYAVRELVQVFARDGRVDALHSRMLSFAEIKEVLGVEEYLSLRTKLGAGGKQERAPS
jgi:methylisocitrate lyase